MLERFVNGQDVFIFQPTVCLNLWFPERQVTKSTKSHMKLNTKLKRQNSQANRSITFYNTSLWQGHAKLFLKEPNRG